MKRYIWLVAVVCGLGLSACQNAGPKPLIGDFKIGERVQVGPMIYNVYDTQYLLKLGDEPEVRIPANRFLTVRLTAVNSGGAQADESIPTLTLVDDSGAVYNEMANGAGVAQWLGFSRKVRPAESVTGNVVFDVAPKHYKLRIADDTDAHYALVDLPLGFGDSTSQLDSIPPPPHR